MKRIVLSVLLAAAIIAAVALGMGKKDSEKEGSCSVFVSCETVLKNGADKKDFPEDGVILKTENCSFSEGETAFDVMSRVFEENNVEAVFKDSAYGKYITEVSGVKEGDFSNGSGWLFKVNGEFAEVGCSSYVVKNDDVIEVLYTCDMGNDLND